jgi:pimeloyl-ACP methyl ester carboxylesterase
MFDKRGLGLSERELGVGTFERRTEDIGTVMDAAGFDHANIVGMSEGGPMAVLFAATYPERTTALILHGTFAKQEWDDSFAARLAETPEQLETMVEERWADGFPGLEVWAPSFAASAENRAAYARFQRQAASPAAAAALLRMSWQIDVRPILPSIHVPTLILHRRHERAFGVKHARYLADHIPDAKYVEMPGVDHLLFAGDHEAIAAEIEKISRRRPLSSRARPGARKHIAPRHRRVHANSRRAGRASLGRTAQAAPGAASEGTGPL